MMKRPLFVKSRLLGLLLMALPLVTEGQRYSQYANTPLPGPDEPVMAGYDVVEYHNLLPSENGVAGNPSISYRHTNGYLYYFVNEANKAKFIADPEQYLPAYGGFCAWGMAWEWPDKGWPWAASHMGPPCGPSDGWAILDGRLYCSIWRSYQTDFNNKQEEGIRAADARWIDYYGNLTAGPQNNGCYAWNWQECFSRSIYDPTGSGGSANAPQTPPVYPAPSPPQSGIKLFENEPVSAWSKPQTVLGDEVMWSWTLKDLATSSPKLIVEMVVASSTATTLPSSNSYVAFGVAEHLMQGALVVCAPQPTAAAAVSDGTVLDAPSSCHTLFGAGMGTTKPEQDPVQPTVLGSYRNETHYTVRFSASLLGCWSRPRLPAGVIFARGLVSGNGDPQPHPNNLAHRQAVTGVDFLSVVEGYNVEENRRPQDIPVPAILEPLADEALWVPVPGTAGFTDILDDRVRIVYELFEYSGEEIVQIKLQNVEFGSEETYVGFGFAQDVMTGLVITCAPRISTTKDVPQFTASCREWRGLGTNLYPLYATEDPGGWFLTAVESSDGTHINYTLAGRAKDVVQAHGRAGNARLAADHVRVICAVGRSAPEVGTPLIHTARDRVGLALNGLAASASQKSEVAAALAVSSAGDVESGQQSVATIPSFLFTAALLLLFMTFQ